MQLSATRYVKIDGTSVSAAVNTAAEAKHAIKEVRQKKRELAHVKRGLLREKKAAEKQAGAASRGRAKKQSMLAKAFSTVAAVAGSFSTASAKMDLPRIERDCAQADEILHNLDAVQIQLEGKLLHLS